MKNYSNWLGFDVKIVIEGFKRGWERFKIGFPQKSYLKSCFWAIRDWRVASESQTILCKLVTGSRGLQVAKMSSQNWQLT